MCDRISPPAPRPNAIIYPYGPAPTRYSVPDPHIEWNGKELYFAGSFNSYHDLPNIPEQYTHAVAHDSSKVDEYHLFVYTNGQWAKESVAVALTI